MVSVLTSGHQTRCTAADACIRIPGRERFIFSALGFATRGLLFLPAIIFPSGAEVAFSTRDLLPALVVC